MPPKMKKILLLISVCALFSACKPDPVKYGELIIGAWEVKDKVIDIAGVYGENNRMITDELNEKFDWVGDIFEFKTGNVVSGPGGDGTYYIDGSRLQMTPAGSNALNFTIVSLVSRSLVLTYDAAVELPTLTSLYPKLTRCLVTITATKKNKAATTGQ